MGKKLLVIISLLLFIQSAIISVAADDQPCRDEINEIINEVALQKNIPPVLLRAIAWKESGKRQFHNGQPFVHAGNQGVMQINRVHNSSLDKEALLNDARYNVEVGADVLLNRWLFDDIATVGERDPDVLENWYFALWGYNGWLPRNNPVDQNGDTYQDGIFDLIRERYDVPVSDIDWSQIPAGERTPRGFGIPNPDRVSDGHLLFYQPGDLVEAVPEDLWLLEAPGADHTGWAPEGSRLRVISHEKLEAGLYWYRLESVDNGSQGWARSIDLLPVKAAILAEIDVFSRLEETEQQVITLSMPEEAVSSMPEEAASPSSFMDLKDHPSQEAVERLSEAGIISGTQSGRYEPDRPMTREELAVVFEKAFDLDNQKEEEAHLPKDWEKVSEWAQEPMETVIAHRIMTEYGDGTVRPKKHATREQVLVMVTKALELELEATTSEDPNFADADSVSEWAVPAVNKLVEKEIIPASEKLNLFPDRAVTRGELAILLDGVIDKEYQ
ncbi:S-layer homology domain-containing protein [Tindallia californiensis]|uniref:S-layer homology domain-containing protein n=1 Tax=Tindallia californiensis TaxID=159292 RepID=A0A1H3LF19_9FIRM|nr:S-layer homology domain-containing protein [Tindallia californiensis]SDY63032.1 S-layer homology domain-containing protein [Tindallia californiensis]